MINFGTGEFDLVGDLNEIDETNFSGTVGLNYTLPDGTLLYAKAAQGFKSGGFNAGFLDFTDGVTVNDIAYDAEELTSYEGGIKWTSSCLLYSSPSPRDATLSRMPSSA